MLISSMRGRVTLGFGAALAVLMALVVGGMIWYARYIEGRNADAVLRMGANRVRQELEDEPSLKDVDHFIRQQSAELRADGMVVLNQPPSTGSAPPSAVPIQTGGHTLRIPIGDREMVLGVPWDKTERRLREQAAALIALAAFGTLAGTACAWFLVGRTLSPIAALSMQADGARVEHLQVRLTAPSSDSEIVQLVSTLNHLLDRLADTASVQARFYAAASHELRTPLHTLSGHLEVGLSRERTNAEYRAAMDEAYRQTARLSTLVQDLLLLTRLNTARSNSATERIDLSELCLRSLDQMSKRIQSRSLCVENSFAPGCTVLAAPNHAEMVVRNLVENAVNHALPPGRIRIAVSRTARTVTLEIENDAPPLLIADVRQLVEPFFRPDLARNSETGGNGLGLAICDAIARADGWDLDLSQPDGRFLVTVKIPAEDGA